jgi:hypothetical protein
VSWREWRHWDELPVKELKLVDAAAVLQLSYEAAGWTWWTMPRGRHKSAWENRRRFGQRLGFCTSGSEKYGVPRALYTDWKNVYKRAVTPAEQLQGETPITQFGRMCQKLGIRTVAASSPQTKGRVERNHGTHQDRLVKKLRRKGIGSCEGEES